MATPNSADLVWYAGYGSNLDPARFGHYIGGGSPAGARRRYPGCRDRTPPRAETGIRLPGQVYFAWESPTWGGGIAFLRPDPREVAYARAYLITVEQFRDLIAQEMHREPGCDVAAQLIPEDAEPLTLGPGRYETVCRTGTIDGVPVVTFTASWEHLRVRRNAPAAAYLQTIGAGLRDTFDWRGSRIASYLSGLPGVAPRWTLDALTRLANDRTPIR